MTQNEPFREALLREAREKSGLRTCAEACDTIRAVADGHWLGQWDSTTVIRNDRGPLT